MKNLVILTGAGMSAESGISTFRDAGGLWDRYPVEQVATPEGYQLPHHRPAVTFCHSLLFHHKAAARYRICTGRLLYGIDFFFSIFALYKS